MKISCWFWGINSFEVINYYVIILSCQIISEYIMVGKTFKPKLDSIDEREEIIFLETQVDKALYDLGRFEESRSYTKDELNSALKVIQSNPKIVEDKGYGYLKDFADDYLKDDSKYQNELISKSIIRSISNKYPNDKEAKKSSLQEIAGKET